MGSTSRYGRATINPTSPEAVGICDRCGFLFNLRDLSWQFDWAGVTMINRQLRVCDRCRDLPQEQLRAIILPADPPSVRDPRVEPFLIDERNQYTISAPPGFPQLFPVTASMAVSIRITSTLAASFSTSSSMSVALQSQAMVAPDFAAESSFEVELIIPPNVRITEAGDVRITESGDRRITE
jgi:hypothetical protein